MHTNDIIMVTGSNAHMQIKIQTYVHMWIVHSQGVFRLNAKGNFWGGMIAYKFSVGVDTGLLKAAWIEAKTRPHTLKMLRFEQRMCAYPELFNSIPQTYRDREEKKKCLKDKWSKQRKLLVGFVSLSQSCSTHILYKGTLCSHTQLVHC